MKIDQGVETLQIQFAIVMHGRDDSDQAAFYCNNIHDGSIQETVKTIFYPNLGAAKNIRRDPVLIRR